jgi:nicotinate-nucleotide adenylyltransferase
MEFFVRAAGRPRRLGVFPGAFNPPTRAHLALARAAVGHVDEVVFVLPHVFPHKQYEGAPFDGRVEMLRRAAASEPRFSIAATNEGLFIDIARECRAAYGDETGLAFVCGRDAAERIVAWDYGEVGAIERMLDEFSLLVAARGGEYAPPAHLGRRVKILGTPDDAVSASEVRDRVRSGRKWDHLVPAEIHDLVRRLYG